MATPLYPVCTNHTPNLRGDSNVTRSNGDSDIETFKEIFKDRKTIVKGYAIGLRFDPEISRYEACLADFLVQHPNCYLMLTDDYGHKYAIEPLKEEDLP